MLSGSSSSKRWTLVRSGITQTSLSTAFHHLLSMSAACTLFGESWHRCLPASACINAQYSIEQIIDHSAQWKLVLMLVTLYSLKSHLVWLATAVASLFCIWLTLQHRRVKRWTPESALNLHCALLEVPPGANSGLQRQACLISLQHETKDKS